MEDKEVVLRRAKNAVISRDFDLAIRLYKSLLEEDVKNFELLSELGNLYIKAGDDIKALPYFQQILTFSANNFQALNSVGGIYRRLGKFEQSIQFLEKALETGQNDAEVNYNLGFTYKMMGDPQDAISCFEKVIAKNPTDVLAYNHLGAIYASEKDYKKAISTYKTGLQIDPNHPILQFNMAKSLEAIHDDGAAIQAYETALRGKPGWPEAVQAYAKMLLTHRKTKQAGDMVQNSINLHPQDSGLFSLQGDIFLKQNNFKKASDSYERANELKPYQVEVLCQLAKSYEKAGRLNDALITIADALRIDEENVIAKKTQLHALLSANRLKEAGELIKKLYAENKTDTEIIDYAGQFSILHNNEANAQAYLKKAQELDPDYTEIHYNYAARYKQTGNLESARKHVKAYIDDNMKDVPAWILLGQIEEAAGNDEESLDAFGTAIAFDPNNLQGSQLFKKMDEKVSVAKQNAKAAVDRLDTASVGEEISLDEFGILSDDFGADDSSDDLNLNDDAVLSEKTEEISSTENEEKEAEIQSEEKSAATGDINIEINVPDSMTTEESWEAVDLKEESDSQTEEIDMNAFFADDEIDANPIEEAPEIPEAPAKEEEIKADAPEMEEKPVTKQEKAEEQISPAAEELPADELEVPAEIDEPIVAEEEPEATVSIPEEDIPDLPDMPESAETEEIPESLDDLFDQFTPFESEAPKEEPEQQENSVHSEDNTENTEKSEKSEEKVNEEIPEALETVESVFEEEQEELSEAEKQYSDLINQVSDLLSPLSSVFKTPEDKELFKKEVSLFRELKDAGIDEPYEERAKKLGERVRYLLDLIATKQFKKIGLLQSAELYLKQGSVKPEATPFEELGKIEIKKTLRNLQGLTDFLEDQELSKNLVLTCERIIEKL